MKTAQEFQHSYKVTDQIYLTTSADYSVLLVPHNHRKNIWLL